MEARVGTGGVARVCGRRHSAGMEGSALRVDRTLGGLGRNPFLWGLRGGFFLATL